MKKLFLFFSLLLTSHSYSQELMNFYIEPAGSNTVSLHTLVYKNTFTSLGSFSTIAVDNIITVTLCYLNTSGQSITFDPQINDINLPNGYSTYTINIELYGDNDATQPCSLDNLADTGTITFEYPYNPTATTFIPDNAFEGYLEDLNFGDDIVNNDLVFTHRIINTQNLFLDGNFIPLSGDIFSMEGVQYFINLKDLRCKNNQITSLDLSNNLKLEWLLCNSNPLNQINISNSILLNLLFCRSTDLANIDLTNNINLERLDLGKNNIETIDLSQNINLVYLDIDDNLLTELNIDNNTLLVDLDCSHNSISSINFFNNINLISLDIKNNILSSLVLSNNALIEQLTCSENLLTELNLNSLTNLKWFGCSFNQITSIDLSLNHQLEAFEIRFNNLNSFNLKNGNNSNITYMNVQNNDNLYCIEVDTPSETPYPGWYVDNQVVFSEECSLGVNDVLAPQITLYPNPVQNSLTIKTTSNAPIISIEVFDVLGKRILLEKSNRNRLNVAHLNKGIYFINITTEKGTLTKKLVKK